MSGRAEVSKVSKKYGDLNIYHLKLIGGFSFYKDHCLNVHTGIKIADPLPESDLQGTFMACECFTQRNGNVEIIPFIVLLSEDGTTETMILVKK